MTELSDQIVRDRYEILGILDSKASALLSFNALFMAVLAIWLGYIPLNYAHLVFDTMFVALVVSSLILLYVIDLKWFGNLPVDQTEWDKLRRTRTNAYTIARRISFWTAVALALGALAHLAGTYSSITGVLSETLGILSDPNWFGNIDQRAGRQ